MQDLFHDIETYKSYLLLVKYCEKINYYIDNDYLVFEDAKGSISKGFTIPGDGTIYEGKSKSWFPYIFGTVRKTKTGKICRDGFTELKIKKYFKNYRIIPKSDLKKLYIEENDKEC